MYVYIYIYMYMYIYKYISFNTHTHTHWKGGFRENLFGWFCVLFAPLFAPFELRLCHELTIGAGYHSQSYAKRLSVYIVSHITYI